MATDLKWRTGFDWGSVLLLATGSLTALLASGWLRLVGLVLGAISAAFMLFQYRKWNTPGWPAVHFRAMLAYANVAGAESGRAQAEGRPTDRVAACRGLALLMCGADKAANVEAMIETLQAERGRYLVSLLRRHASDLLPSADATKFEQVLSDIGRAEFGPQLVICNIVENSYGELEAARYALALIRGDAY
jgi:hypothetical protein